MNNINKQLDKSSLSQLISQGENVALEFKREDVKSDSLASEIVALANTHGGSILIGVDDSGEILGVEHAKKLEERVCNIARNNVIPPIDIFSEEVDSEDKVIVHIRVPKGKDKPYQTLKHQFLVRVGSTKRVATQQELMRLFQQSGAFHFDAVSIEKAKINALNLYEINAYFNRYDVDFENDDDKERVLKNIDILDESGSVTYGGLLVFGMNPQKFIPNASISFAHYSGFEIDETLIDKKTIEGNLPQQVENTLSVIMNNMSESSSIEGSKTKILTQNYPEKVFRELIVNAVVHRNYSISGSRIRIFMFKDRIEFISPGNLPNTISIEKLRVGVSYAPNPILLKFMENLRYVDKLGRGLPMVVKEAHKIDQEVTFEELGNEFKVTLTL